MLAEKRSDHDSCDDAHWLFTYVSFWKVAIKRWSSIQRFYRTVKGE